MLFRSIFLLDGGPLEVDYKSIAKVYYKQPNSITSLSYLRRLFNKVFKIKHDPLEKYKINLYKDLNENKYDLIYGNTVVSSSIVNELLNYLNNIKTILHVHELYYVSSYYTEELSSLSKKKIRYICVSEITIQNLIKNHNVSKSQISLVYEYIDTLEVLKNVSPIINNKFTIHGSGSVEFRKGFDIFLLVAKRAIQKFPEIPFYFKWIGLIPPHLEYFIKCDIEQSGLANYVDFIGALENPFSEFSQSSVFLMTSRQDPFPLVCLEHALLGKTIICFDKGTGIPEFIENDAGLIVPYLDVEAIVDSLNFLYTNPEKLMLYGKIAGQKALNYDIDIQCRKILNIINEVVIS